MKIRILKENMFGDSRNWKSIDDFENWNLSQVKALAKYSKGEGKFDYEFYEKTYDDLKKLTIFLNDKCRRIEAADNHYWWREKLKNVKKKYREGIFRETMVWGHGVEYFLHQEKLNNKKLTDLLKLKVSAVVPSSRTKSFGTKVLLEYLVCSKLEKSEKERLKDALQNMEKLRKTYPFKLKHLPTFTRMAGLEEAQEKGAKYKIDTKVVENNDDGYKSTISIELKDKIIYQVLTIQPVGSGLYAGSEGEKDIKRCYPRTLSEYPQEIQQLEPWEINGNSLRVIYRTAPTILTYEINFEILSIKPLDDKEERNVDPYSDNIFGNNTMAALSFFREVMKQVGEYVKNNPWYIYSFFGIETDEEMGELTFDEDHVNKRTKLYLMALKRLQRQLPGEWVVTYPEKGNPNSIIFFKCPMSGINEVSSMGGGAVQGFGAPFSKEEEKLIQEMYSSAAIMGSGGGGFPKERSPEGHKRYVRMRHDRQGLQNFKRNRYFKENTSKQPKIRIKIRKNLGERCQKGYKTHPTRKTKKMFGRTYRNCVKAEGVERLEENKLDSYSNVWKRWETFDDFDKWNRSQVLALAKHRKGQGKFDFRFYDKVYEDLKQFLTKIKEITQHPAFADGTSAPGRWHITNLFRGNLLKDSIFRDMDVKENIFFQLIVRRKWFRELGPNANYIIKDGRLEQELKNMESLRETYPWNKKHLPTIQKQLGIYEGKDPKKGTGKKPKGSGRRLYTDENPSDTVSVKFSTVQDIKDTFSKASFKSKSHKRQSQIINLVHQRVRAAYQNAKDPDVKKRLKKAFDYAKKRKEASKKKTQSMKKDK